MKAGTGDYFEQSYNAQAAVEVVSRLIVGQRVSQSPNDKQELPAGLQAIPHLDVTSQDHHIGFGQLRFIHRGRIPNADHLKFKDAFLYIRHDAL
jgi:hypothetical protein